VPRAEWLILGPAAAFLDLGPGWASAYAPILGLVLLSLVLLSVDLARPHRSRVRMLVRVGAHCAGLVLVLALMHVGNFVVLSAGAAGNALYARIPEIVNADSRSGLPAPPSSRSSSSCATSCG
jgi:hypothetical protein